MSSIEEYSKAVFNSEVFKGDLFIEIVEEKLRRSRENFKILDVVLTPATKKNENFAAAIYYAKIKVEQNTDVDIFINVVIKVMFQYMEELKEFSHFSRERFVYKNILKSFADIWHEKTGEEISFGPECFKHQTVPYDLMVLEDLKELNYEKVNIKVGLNLEQTKAVLSKLAKYHATSVVYLQKV